MSFKCCKFCEDKRHPGCSATCPDYADELEDWKARKKFLNGNSDVRGYVRMVTSKNKNDTIKRKQRGRK